MFSKVSSLLRICRYSVDSPDLIVGLDTLQHYATHCNTPQHTATHCTTLHHTATHCNTLQHINRLSILAMGWAPVDNLKSKLDSYLTEQTFQRADFGEIFDGRIRRITSHSSRFSKVSSLLYLLCERTIELTFENFQLLSLANTTRQTIDIPKSQLAGKYSMSTNKLAKVRCIVQYIN